MRALLAVSALVLTISFLVAPGTAFAKHKPDNKARCAGFGFEPGTDAFAQCVMRLSLEQDRRRLPDRNALIRRYREQSMSRRGDDRYPVCTAGMMDNELDVSTGRWVGPSCQMAPD